MTKTKWIHEKCFNDQFNDARCWGQRSAGQGRVDGLSRSLTLSVSALTPLSTRKEMRKDLDRERKRDRGREGRREEERERERESKRGRDIEEKWQKEAEREKWGPEYIMSTLFGIFWGKCWNWIETNLSSQTTSLIYIYTGEKLNFQSQDEIKIVWKENYINMSPWKIE